MYTVKGYKVGEAVDVVAIFVFVMAVHIYTRDIYVRRCLSASHEPMREEKEGRETV